MCIFNYLYSSVKILFVLIISFSMYNCSKSSQNQNLKKETLFKMNSAIIDEDPFSESFVSELKNIAITEEFNKIDKIEDALTKIMDKNYVNDDESKYNTLFELAGLLPEPHQLSKEHVYKNKYKIIISKLNEYYEKTAISIPKVIHFTWFGGPLGEIQKDYIKIWAKLNPEYTINIWYDSDNLYTYESNKKIKEYLNNILVSEKNKPNYSNIFSEKYINIQNDLFEKLIQNNKEELSYDKLRLNYIEKMLYNKSDISYIEIDKNIAKITKDAEELHAEYKNIFLKDIKENKNSWQLQKIYTQEMFLRGNFAAASDSARLEILGEFGGIYMDVDILPSLKPLNDFYDNNIHGEFKNFFLSHSKRITLLFFETVLNNNRNLIPSRQLSNRFLTGFDEIIEFSSLDDSSKIKLKQKMKEALNNLNNIKEIHEIFNKLSDIKVRKSEYKKSEYTNNFIATHKIENDNDFLLKLKNEIFNNYKKINKIESNNPNFTYEYDKKYILQSDAKNYIRSRNYITSYFDSNILQYRQDSIFPTRFTIYTSGPAVYAKLMENEFSNFTNVYGDLVREDIFKNRFEIPFINTIFNNATEEDVKSSWSVPSKNLNFEEFGFRNIVFSVGSDENAKLAAKNIFDNMDKKNTTLLNLDNLTIENINENEYLKINLFIVGESTIEQDNMRIGNLLPNELADKIIDLQEKNKNVLIDYIDIKSSNPINNKNNIEKVEQFSKNLLENLYDVGIKIDVVTFRREMIYIDNSGNELVKDNILRYRDINDIDKIYSVRNDRNKYTTFSLENINDVINKNKNLENSNSKKYLVKKLKQLGPREKLNIISKYSLVGLDKFTNITTKYNVFMSLLNTPQIWLNTYASFKNEMYLDGGRNLANYAVNNADLALDAYKSVQGVEFWKNNLNSYKNINRLQMGLNFASSAIDIWTAYDLYKNSSQILDTAKKLDAIVNASFTAGSAVSSFATMILLPVTAKAGPIGAAIGYSIMFSQGTYNAVRTSQELRKLGFSERDITLKSILKFFGSYEILQDPSYITKIESNKMNNEIIPNLLYEKNKEYFSALDKGNGEENKLFFFKKLIYPKIDHYIPFTDVKTVLGCGYGVCASSKSGGIALEKERHFCLTNNFYAPLNSNKTEKMKNIHLNAIRDNHSLLALKTTERPRSEVNQRYSHASVQYYNDTIPCPSVSISTNMLEKYYIVEKNNKEKFNKIPDNKKANLYFAGFGDQGTHGNMIHTIIGESQDINFYNIHPATYMLHIIGGSKEDYFDFYDVLRTKTINNGFIDGGDGIDTINLQGIKNKKIIVSLDASIKSNFLEINNVENIFGSDSDDEIHGNNQDNVIDGNNGHDTIHGYDGNDILIPGKGNDTLIGGKGNDTYIIFESNLLSNNSVNKKYIYYKIIYNYDDTFSNIDSKSVDYIKTNIKNLYSRKNNNNLTFGFYFNNEFIKAFEIKDYFISDKYQHIKLVDMSGNLYISRYGNLYDENINETELNVILLNQELSEVYLDKLENINLDVIKNVSGTIKDDIIHGNENDNEIFGVCGNDKLYGHAGNDTISIGMMFCQDDKTESIFSKYISKIFFLKDNFHSILSGGNGEDNYILNLKKSDHSESHPYKVIIENEDKDKKIDNLIFNFFDFKIQSIVFSKNSVNNDLKIDVLDEFGNNYHVYVKNWFQTEEFRHLQIQMGNIFMLSTSMMEQITNFIKTLSENFTINIYDENSFIYSDLYLKEGSAAVINTSNLNYYPDNIQFMIANDKFITFKISKLDNEIILKLDDKNNPNLFSFVLYKTGAINNLKTSNIVANNQILIKKNTLSQYLNEIQNAQIIVLELDESSGN